MKWDGKERRNVSQWQSAEILEKLAEINISIGVMSEKIEHNHKAFRTAEVWWKEQTERLDGAIFGKEGLNANFRVLKDSFDRHDEDDKWFHRTIFLSGIGVIAFLIIEALFK